MREEFFLDFPGFHGFLSKCHLRILAEKGKPIVIICSQPPNNLGTSVQNAYEIIRDHVYEYLQSKTNELKKEKAAIAIDEFAVTVEKTKKLHIAFITFILRQVSGILRNKESVLALLKDEKPEVVWIEHWPKGTGFDYGEVDYLLVSENEVGSPSWNRIKTNDLSKKLGYDVTDIEIPDETFA